MMQSLVNQVNEKQLKSLVENASDFAGANGIVMLANDTGSVQRFKHVPFTLFPSPVPRKDFENLVNLQPHITKLMHLLSLDYQFLSTSIQSVVKADDFMANLFEIYEKTHMLSNEALTLGLLRTDYMLDDCTKLYKQIEVNTISSSFGGVGTDKIRRLHTTVLKEKPLKSIADKIPPNLTLENLGKGLAHAWNAYGEANAIVVFFIAEQEYNVFDQRVLEYEIYRENPSIVVRRELYNSAVDRITLNESTRCLYIDDEEIAVAYFRSCYMPHHFPEKKHWDIRLKIEQSKAVKSPSIGHQLVGSKKVQEILTRSDIVERYVDEETAGKIRQTFTGLYSLDMSEQGSKVVKMAMENPDDFVLKPQREGGGNNLYGAELRERLEEIGGDERRCAYVIMDKIRPRPTSNYIISDSTPNEANVVSELGIFGVSLTRGKAFLENFTAGHLLRSKSDQFQDGGVMSGVSVLDSPYLVEHS